MRIFLSSLTLYTYEDRESRESLNLEESTKFLEGIRNAGKYEKIKVFSPYNFYELRELLENFEREKKWFEPLLSGIENPERDWVKTELTNYEKAYEKIYTVVEDMFRMWIESEDKKLEIYMNLSCGHKIGSLALYMAVLNLLHGSYYGYLSGKKGRSIRVRPYHAEKGIVEELPVMNFKNESNIKYEMYLGYLQTPLTLEGFKSMVEKDEPGVKNYGDKVVMYLTKRSYIILQEGKIRITIKGKTLYEVLQKLEKV